MAKILIVISSLRNGGAERAVSNLTINLPRDWEIDILLNNDRLVEYPYRGRLLSLGLEEEGNMSSLIFHYRLLYRRIKTLRTLKRTGEYDACISYLSSANAANILSGHGCPTIISIRSNMSTSPQARKINKFVVNAVIKVLYNFADYSVAVSKGVAEDLIIHYGIKRNKLTTIYNGYDVQDIQQKAFASDKTRDKDEFVISTCGRLDYLKGQWHLIRCVYYLKEKYPNIRLNILGRGPYLQYFEEMIAKGNLEQNVSLLGFQENPFRWIGESDLFVFPSQYEGFANALVEAMACKVPCIATDFQSSAREILAPDTDLSYICSEGIELAKYGVITPVCSSKKMWFEPLEKEELYLKEAIEMFILDSDLRIKYSQLSEERAKMLSIESSVREWINLISKAGT